MPKRSILECDEGSFVEFWDFVEGETAMSDLGFEGDFCDFFAAAVEIYAGFWDVRDAVGKCVFESQKYRVAKYSDA